MRVKQVSAIAISAVALTIAACQMGSGDPAKAGAAMSGVTDTMIAQGSDNEWLSYGRDYGEQRFSPLTAVNDQNVGQLGLAWFADLDTARGQEATPLMHDGVIYVSTAWSMVKAYDATTGALKWAYDPKVPRETVVRACCDAVNRGVAIYGDKIYVGTLDGRLVALDAKSGKEVFAKVVVPDQQNYTITGAPRVVKGRIVIGAGGGEYRARGYIAAYDPNTGAEVWRFNTVPGNPKDGFDKEGLNKAAMEAAAKTWGGDWWTLGGGGTVWDSITYDPSTNLVLFGTGNAEPWNPAASGRDGDALYTSSIVAVNADTGQYAWHYQETPEDRWDFDSDAQITIADLTIDGQKRHVAIHAPKNGHVYVIDVKTGQFLSATPWVPVNWTTGIDPKTGKATIAPEARYEKTGKAFVGLPGAIGAHSWHAQSFNPKTGLLYIPTNIAAQGYVAAKDWKPSAIGYQFAIDPSKTTLPAEGRAAAKAATTGALVAWDVVNKKEAWRVPMPSPWNGGVLSTAGNLVFQGNAQGQFAAYSADKGQKLWSFATQSGVIAPPMTYAINGEQYVAVLVGWGGVWDLSAGILAHSGGAYKNISRLMVFKLGGKAQLPAAPKADNQAVLDPPPFTGTADQVARGGALYGRYCTVCHGDAAIAGGLVPDLRHSGALGSDEAIRSIVIDGVLHQNGMVSFKSALKPEDAEDLRQFLIKRANDDKALEDKKGG
ncbi:MULTISPECIES: PQQ-dependent dehydrogenase, methanol/ethanol family [Novosphingobium]|uniref:PQQ-dependent dehydrogenase, methanol/ethanol family n=1 Tax=Novosphingobium TaxID=165696 RepID=UPI001CD2BEBE|nr:PQQ-dependent dehydrogenase, methanol/ethanol family [Novosphingobium percolationis]